MRLTLRTRIVLTLIPLFVVLAALGAAGVVSLYQVGNRIDDILRENYRSVVYMNELNEALERIDSSFHLDLLAEAETDADLQTTKKEEARQQYDENRQKYQVNLEGAQENVTLPGEQELLNRLLKMTQQYRQQGDHFFGDMFTIPEKQSAYSGQGDQPGLLQLFQDIKTISREITRINQTNMEQASQRARSTAMTSLAWFGGGLVVAAILGAILAWHMVRTIIQPIRAVTESARGISAGNLDQIVPVLSRDELGEVAEAFNVMARHLREYRQSQSAQLWRVQQTTQATIDSFPDAVLVIDRDGQVEMANPAARNLLGVVPKQPNQLPSTSWQIPEPLREPLAEALHGERDYLPEDFNRVIVLGSNGHERSLLPRILTIRDAQNHTLGAAVLLQDVTRLRLMDQVKGNLVATASHELKTPLTSIRLAVHLLLEESVGTLNPKQLELLLDARDNCERLLAMVNNLLDVARLEQGSRQLDLRPVLPSTLFSLELETIRPRAQDKGVEIDVHLPPGLPSILVDPDRIGHALSNLLDNALFNTDNGGRITLSAELDGDFIVLSIADTGRGIPSEHLPQVFEKFFRVPGQSRGSGTGLGLAIVNEIAVAHGGQVTCESQVGVGTTFRLRLPIVISDHNLGGAAEQNGAIASHRIQEQDGHA